jgi:PAS domain S-box-containing protein
LEKGAVVPTESGLAESILGAITDAITVVSADGRMVYANALALDLLGFATLDELRASPSERVLDRFELLTPDGGPLPRERLPGRRALAGEDHVEERVRYRVRATGEERESRVSAQRLGSEPDGTPLAITVFHDVTAEARAEARLRETATLLDLLFSAAPVGFAFLDREQRYVRVNDALARINGLAPEAHVGRTFSELIPALGPAVEKRVRRVLETGEPLLDQEESGEIPSAPGERRFWNVSYYPIASGTGELLGVGVVVVDLTEQRRSEIDRLRLERVTEATLKQLPLDDLLHELLTRLVELLGGDTAAIFLVDESGGMLTARATVGLEEVADNAYVTIPVGRGVSGRVAATQQPLIVGETDSVELVHAALPARGVHSLIAVPLLVEDRTIGVLRVGSAEPDRFTADDTRVLELAADRIALAVNQSALYEAAARASARLELLAEASDVLASPLDVDATLERLAELLVPGLADLCAIHLLGDDGAIRSVAVVHRDPDKMEWLRRHAREHPYDAAASTAVPEIIRSGRPELFVEVTAERIERLVAERPDQEALLRELVGASAIAAPLATRDRTFGTLTLVVEDSGRRYGEEDFAFARELARRTAVAVDNALLFRRAEERGRAARILESVGDGVFLVSDGIVRFWNEAAAAITGLAPGEVLERPAADAIPGWSLIEPLVPPGGPSQTMPLQLGSREAWLSISGVGLDEGTVYAFRDLTEERALEELRADFVATVSHELRTPLAAIYGAAMTLRRDDVELDETQRTGLLGVVASEADRLARTVNDILWASRLDVGTLSVAIGSCDPAALVESVIAAQRTHLPPRIELALETAATLPDVAADGDKVRQVLVNLVDNAVKYSPEGGRVTLTVTRRGTHVRFAVSDEGLGIPYADQRRIFDKFYRLDPQLTRGVGGTGLGLYISRELVRRMNGRIWVRSTPGRSSTFYVELPVAGGDDDLRLGGGPDASGRPGGRPGVGGTASS